ncbi:hypothetical protein NC652_036643 [Populus alba x Populus x berolinensis]|nr:hypothetical protein NC652_036643 [Populus alba x Populus x berolinensis]
MSSGLEQNSLRIIQCQVDRKAAMFNQFWKMLYWNERSLEWGPFPSVLNQSSVLTIVGTTFVFEQAL